MISGQENRNFDISRRDGVEFKHFQLLVKVLWQGMTEHHNLDIFTTGPDQLLEMRRVFAKTYRTSLSANIYNVIRNN